jgi:hypothetical protein
VTLSRAEVIAEATDLTGRDGLTLVEALSVLLLEGYADTMTDSTFRIGQWTVAVS